MDFAEQVKTSVDIVHVIGESVRLRKIGARFIGLCPFHNEKTPSFNVHPQHQFFKCFGCGEAGDVFAFVMKQEGVSFFEALKSLAERNGIPIPKRSGYTDDEAKRRAAVYRMHEIAESEFQRQLGSEGGREGNDYLTRRGISREIAVRFGLGYAPRAGQLSKLLAKEGFSPAELEESGLVLKREDGSLFDRFRHRLMFPIHNESGKTIAFGGRALAADEKAKYLNSPETSIYRKSHVLYNLHRAKDRIRARGRAVLVEGYMDAIAAWSAGVEEAVASCGTSLTGQQVQALRRQSPNILVNFDADNAGESAVERSIGMLLAEGLHIRVVALEGGLDPDDYCRAHGSDAYNRQVDEARGYFHWLSDRARARHDMRSAEGRYSAFQILLPAVQALPDKLQRAAVANDIAGYLGIDPPLVLESFRKMSAGDNRTAAPTPERETMRHRDRILISVLLGESARRDEFLEYLRALPSLKIGRPGKIYEAVLSICDGGQDLTYGVLHARLTESDQQFLADGLLLDDTSAEPSFEDGLACLEALIVEERDGERNSLKARVREAERAGNLAEALRLSAELSRLQTRG